MQKAIGDRQDAYVSRRGREAKVPRAVLAIERDGLTAKVSRLSQYSQTSPGALSGTVRMAISLLAE